MLNYRKIEILHTLFQNEFTDPQKIAQQTALSVRTLFSEMTQINEILQNNQIELQIQIQRGKGYYLTYPIEQTFDVERLRRHCTEYLNVAINTRFGENTRIAWIVRHFLLQKRATKAEELSEMLNISSATLNKDLRIIRRTLQDYGLQIETTPYHGMRVIGEEMAMRSCLLDFCDLYSFNEDSIFEEYSKTQYNIDDESVLTTRLYVYQQCQKHSYKLTETGFTRIANYLMIMPNRAPIVQLKQPLFLITESLKASCEYQLAKLFLPADISEVEISYFMVMLLASREYKGFELTPLIQTLLPTVEADMTAMLTKIERQLNFTLTGHESVYKGIANMLTKISIRKKYHVFEYGITDRYRDIMRKAQASVSLALYIFEIAGWATDTSFADYNYCDLVFAIYDLAYQYHNTYQETEVVFVCDNIMAYNSLWNSINTLRFKINIHHHHFYELMYIDYTKYDYVFISKENSINKIQFPIPVFEYDVVAKQGQMERLWDNILMKRRILNSISDGFVNPHIATLKTDTKNVARDIVNIFLAEGAEFEGFSFTEIENIVYHLIFNLEAQLEQEFLFARSYVIFATKLPTKMHCIIDLKKPLRVKQKEISTLHFFFLDLEQGPIIVKNGDSEIKRLTTL